ncbi:hypothetical protein AMECASPLE_033148 [Ameca splendens]|uniref:Uncharacterized protein n=1 Tax=Ameca splendens TaxID=208324 RepID=A0ABV0YUM7_9TELE
MDGAVASLGDTAVADGDARFLAAALTSAGRETTAPDFIAAAMGDSSPAETPKALRADVSCGGRRTSASLLDLGVQPGTQAENGAEPPHAPSAPSTVERAEPPAL